MAKSDCPCGTGKPYRLCCARLHAGQPAIDAEQLMRSRYSAYVKGLAEYLLDSWHPHSRPPELDLHDSPKWLGLTVIATNATGSGQASVEFVARFFANGQAQRLHERSRFRKEGQHWFYLDGEILSA